MRNALGWVMRKACGSRAAGWLGPSRPRGACRGGPTSSLQKKPFQHAAGSMVVGVREKAVTVILEGRCWPEGRRGRVAGAQAWGLQPPERGQGPSPPGFWVLGSTPELGALGRPGISGAPTWTSLCGWKGATYSPEKLRGGLRVSLRDSRDLKSEHKCSQQKARHGE